MTGLRVAAADLEAAVRALDQVVVALHADPRGFAGWTGPAADAAARGGVRLAAVGADLAERARALVGPLQTVADDLVVPLAGVAGVPGVGPAGALGPPTAIADPPPTAEEAAAAGTADLRITEIDDRLAAALDRALVPAGGGPAGAAGGPDPAAVAAWWSGMGPAERDRLVVERPELVGGLDGVPAAARDRANRDRLRVAEDEATAARLALLVEVLRARRIGRTPRGLDLPWHRVGVRLERLAALRAALDQPGRRLLAFDEGPDTVRAAVAAGDVDAAAHIGVLTPGFTADVRDLHDRLAQLEAVGIAAGPGTATVAWYGYDAPQWSGVFDPETSVLSTDAARDGGARLAGFLDGLDATRPTTPAHLTAIGHSYGSVTTAQAFAAGADGVDDVIYVGSPGVAPELGAPPGRAWVIEAPGDVVADTGWFGPDPNGMPGVVGLSAREAVLPGGVVLDGVHGHGSYLQPGSTSSHNVAAVVGGRPGDAVLDRGIGVGDRLRRLVPARGVR